MIRFLRSADQLSRRSRKTERRRKSHLNLDQLEQRLVLSTVSALVADVATPRVLSVSLPTPKTYGTGSALTFKLNFNEPVQVVGNKANVFVPVEVGYAMRQAEYLSGSGSRSLTFRVHVTANDVDSDGISLGRVNSNAVRDFDFAAKQIRGRLGKTASNAIPAVDTSRIRVDATGPVVSGYSSFTTRGQQVSLQVTFDGPVSVTGKPTVPVTIGGENTELQYRAGSGSSTLTFAVTMPKNISVTNPTFRGENDLPGEVILLPKNANLKDRFGNSVTAIGSNYGETYEHEGKRVVVIGTHYEKLTTITKAELNNVFTEERKDFNPPNDPTNPNFDKTPDYWKKYENPNFTDTTNDVDLYRVAYRSTIPEQGNRPTVAYGLMALPQGATGSLPLLSVQHGTLWLKESAPSQAFSWNKNEETTPFKYGLTQKQLYDSCYETRLNVAQFAGHGYAVIAPDYFGIGNSVENDSFVVKASEQQACLDMYNASQNLIKNLNLSTNKLFLNGWSQGALVAISFQEALEARGIKVDGVSTAATPANTGMFAEQFIFNPRPYSTETVPNAAWSIFVHQFSSFALSSYSGQTNAPLELFGGNYEVSRKFFMREFKTMPYFQFQPDSRDVMEPVMVMDGVTYNTDVSKFPDQKVTQSPLAYEQTAYAKLIRNAASGDTRLVSDMLMYYGEQDEGYAIPVCTYVDTLQRGTFGKTNIQQVPVPYASHRSTFLTAVAGQLDWFKSKQVVPNAALDHVIFVGGGTIDDNVASVILSTMDGIDYPGTVTANSDSLYAYAMQSQWKLQTYLNMSDYPILLSESRPLNPFPIEYRSDSIKVYNSRLLQGLPDNPQWPGDYQSGEAFLKAQLIRAVETGNPLTLVITNPLTPLSMVLKENPSLEKGIKRVIWMGGAINVPGNLDPNTLPVQIANPKAEWNAFWDPYAVDWIFRHTSVPLLVFPLDVTDQAKVTAEFTAALKQQAQQYRYSDLVESLYSLVENQPYFEMWNSLTAVFVGKPEIFEDPTPMRLNIVDEGYMQGTITQGTTGRQALVYLNIKDKPGFYNYVLGQLLRN